MFVSNKFFHSARWGLLALTASSPYSLTIPVAAASLDARCSLAIRHVNIIPMDSPRVLKNQTVRIGEGKILSINASAHRQSSACEQVVDGAQGFLVPGLNDMHTHIETVAFEQAFGV